MVDRFDIFLINLDPEPSEDPKITRPGVVISPDEMNYHINSVLIAPLSSTNAKYPTRVSTNFLDSERFIILDQIRPVEKIRLSKKIGSLNAETQDLVIELLTEMFAK